MRLRPLSDVFSTVALAQEEGAGVGRAGGCRVTLGFLGWVFTLEGLGCSTLGQKKNTHKMHGGGSLMHFNRRAEGHEGLRCSSGEVVMPRCKSWGTWPGAQQHSGECVWPCVAVLSPSLQRWGHSSGGSVHPGTGWLGDGDPTCERRKGPQACLSLRVPGHPSPACKAPWHKMSGGTFAGQPVPEGFEQPCVALKPVLK